MNRSLPNPVLFAHRGSSAHAPENTMAAFQLAINQGAPAIELDVQLSADDEVVVFHDCTLSRTTDGSGKLRRQSVRQLKSHQIRSDFHPVDPEVRIPTLKEVFSELDSNIFLNIELKNLSSPFDPLPKRVAKIIDDHQAADRILISSFNPVALASLHRHHSAVPRGLLLHRPYLVDLCILFPRLISGFQTIHPSFACLTEHRVNSLHKLGKKVFVYTLNKAEDILHALRCGADGFFTDDPQLGLRTLNENGYNSK